MKSIALVFLGVLLTVATVIAAGFYLRDSTYRPLIEGSRATPEDIPDPVSFNLTYLNSDQLRVKRVVDQTDQIIDLSTRDKLVFVNFMASWCAPCMAEMPSIVKLHERIDSAHFQFVISSKEEVEVIEEKIGKRFPELADHLYQYEESSFPSALAADRLPTTFIIYNNQIIYHKVSFENWDSDELVELVNALLDENANGYKSAADMRAGQMKATNLIDNN